MYSPFFIFPDSHYILHPAAQNGAAQQITACCPGQKAVMPIFHNSLPLIIPYRTAELQENTQTLSA